VFDDTYMLGTVKETATEHACTFELMLFEGVPVSAVQAREPSVDFFTRPSLKTF